MAEFIMTETIYHYVEADNAEEALRKFEEGHEDCYCNTYPGEFVPN